MKNIRFFACILWIFLLSIAFPVEAQSASDAQGDVLEVQIPRPKFEIFKAWEYGGFWRWDEKDPRFYRDFLKKIHDSLMTGPF